MFSKMVTETFGLSSIYEFQNEKNYLNHYNEFEYIHHFEIIFKKIDDALLVFVILDNNVYLFEIFIDSLFICIKIKPLSGAFFNFFFRSYKSMFLPLTVKLIISLFAVFFKIYYHIYRNSRLESRPIEFL